jgi:hypothetical protein
MDFHGATMIPKPQAHAVVYLCLFTLVAALPLLLIAQATAAPAEVSGAFAFLKEGEFVQITVEDGQLSGFVSRFGDTDSDKGQFIDQFFDKTSLQGGHLYFKTKTIHAVWYEFDGTLSVVNGKQKSDEGYRVLRGKLTVHTADAKGADHASERTVELKSFPETRR